MIAELLSAANSTAPSFAKAGQTLAAGLVIPVDSVAPLTVSELTAQIHRTPILVIGVLDLCLSIAFLVLFIAAPDFKVFRAASIFLALGAGVQFADYFYAGPFVESIRPVPAIFSVETALEALYIRRRAWARLIWPITLFALVASLFPAMAFVRAWPFLLTQPIFLGIVIVGFRRRNLRDRLIAGAYAGVFLARATNSPIVQRLTGLHSYFSIHAWEWPLLSGVVTIFGFVTLAIFVRDLVFDRSEKLRLATELEAARSVQDVLIPESIGAIEGYSLSSAYRPALEVGGDFFQVLPLSSGETLIVLGDMSGKGLKAAMAVSFLVGALRTLADASDSPASLLVGLDRRLSGGLQGGFVTAVALRIAPDGRCCISSAGHPSPFLNGREMDVPGAFPLGLGLASSYEEANFLLREGDHLALYTDGLLEARNRSGELYSFDRLRALFATRPTAEQATDAAVAFGQDDDITVLTLSRISVCGVG